MEHEGLYILAIIIFIVFILPIIVWTISIIGSYFILKNGRASINTRAAQTQQTHPNMLNNMRTLAKIPVPQVEQVSTFTPVLANNVQESGLIFVNAVYSLSKWSTFLAGLKSLVGGRIESAEKMLTLGRDEAIQRLREEAIRMGWKQVINVRVETMCLNKKGDRPSAFVEFCVYGTGIKF